MRLLKLVSLVVFVLFVFNKTGRSQVHSGLTTAFSEVNKKHFENFSKMINVEGDFFVNKDWTDGTVYFNDKHVVSNVSMRYFIKGKEMHVKHDGKIMKIINQSSIDSILIGDHTFVYSEFVFGSTLSQDFLELLSGGSIKFYKHYTNKFIKAKEVSSYQTQESDKYIIKKEFYVSVNDNAAEFFKPKKKSILALFSDKKEDVMSFVKKNKLKFGREADVIKIFNYYNSL
ncbi:hypothetical protein DWB61_14705 [Ancylomarina euxinus]|uniref:Uncharacterized protein n=1 Tax=Ancylomarina euxinus TaxID=2283627 RepID=A0A425XXZ2_9BACT|nr:hypothetical protein [Ancylomarina euxinus]MCZ4695892.1 hypothetical protein [Ancylomarina euxinus]MUP16267.1 hypothetical protein [Ancylomarina euxinus]RRG19640.1 hypothetical protein DWB61_14705 [Ancylomarina euxinus]